MIDNNDSHNDYTDYENENEDDNNGNTIYIIIYV